MVDELGLTILIEDSVAETGSRLIAKHGLSVFAEAKIGKSTVQIMMDVGPSAEALLNNADILDVNLRKTDVIVLSHGHYDHGECLINLLGNMGKPVPVVAHPRIFNPKFSVDPKLRFNGLSFAISDVEKAGGIPLLTKDPLKIAKGVTTTGEIERITSYENVRGFWTIDQDRIIKDSMLDDQALIFNLKNKGLVVIAGCAHAGIVNTVNYAKKLMKTSKVYGVLGGFHLVGASNERIEVTVKDLLRLSPEFLGPCHCTGEKVTRRLKEAFEDKCRPLKTGDVLRL